MMIGIGIGIGSGGRAGDPPVPAAPANVGAPVIEGGPGVGSLLTLASHGRWTGYPLPYARQWRVGGAAVAGATGLEFDTSARAPGASIDCLVTVTNASGAAQAASNAIVLVAVVPAAPAAPAVSAAGAGTVSVTWAAPATDGGAAVTSYDLRWSTDGGTSWTLQAGVASGGTIVGLGVVRAVDVQVRAVNSVGVGPWSASGSGVSGADVPAAPAAPAVAAVGASGITVSWSAPASDGGAAVTSYDLRVSGDGGTTWTTTAGATSPASVTGLAAGTAYRAQVRAVNAAGAGAWSASGTATTESGALPPPPWVVFDAATYISDFALPHTHQVTWVTRIRFPVGASLTEGRILPNVRLFNGTAADRQLYFGAGSSAFALLAEEIVDAHVNPGDDVAIMIALHTGGGLNGGKLACAWVNGVEVWGDVGTSTDPVGYDWGWGHSYYAYANASGNTPMVGQVHGLWLANNVALNPATHWGAFFNSSNNLRALGAGGVVAGVTPSLYQAGNAAAWNSGTGIAGTYVMHGAATDV